MNNTKILRLSERRNDMDKMPIELKRKIRKLGKLHKEAFDVNQEVSNLLELYGVEYDVLCAMCDNSKVYTEALAFITNAEGDIEENIKDIEEVFLYYVNNKQEQEV
jgi:hypothetical protein